MGLLTGFAVSCEFREIIHQPEIAMMKQSINAKWLHFNISEKQ